MKKGKEQLRPLKTEIKKSVRISQGKERVERMQVNFWVRIEPDGRQNIEDSRKRRGRKEKGYYLIYTVLR